MRVTGLTPQDLKAYGIHDVQESSTTPTTIRCIRKSSIQHWKDTSAVC
jgi:hypothetical protein